MEKVELGKESRIWRNLSMPISLEVCEKLGVKPGDNVQFYACGDSVIVEKA